MENQYQPDSVSPPGETLLETIEALGLSAAELARQMGQSEEVISAILYGNAAITPNIAVKLAQATGVPARFWVNREQQYRIAQTTE